MPKKKKNHNQGRAHGQGKSKKKQKYKPSPPEGSKEDDEKSLEESPMAAVSFNSLFEMNLKDVLEKIFFPLDNASFKNCLGVCPAWQSLLTSEEFQKRRSTFSQRLWMDTENLKHQGHNSMHLIYIDLSSNLLKSIKFLVLKSRKRV